MTTSFSENKLTNFVSEAKAGFFGFIRQPGFEVVIEPPNIIANTGEKFRTLTFKAFSVNTPSTQLSTADEYIEVSEYRKYAYDYMRGIVSVSFYIDSKYDTVNIFEQWKSSIFSERTRAISFYNDYISPKMTINILRKDNSIARRYVFQEVFPKAINEINYDWSQSAVSVLLVTFEYATYRLVDPDLPDDFQDRRLQLVDARQEFVLSDSDFEREILSVNTLDSILADEAREEAETNGPILLNDAEAAADESTRETIMLATVATETYEAGEDVDVDTAETNEVGGMAVEKVGDSVEKNAEVIAKAAPALNPEVRTPVSEAANETKKAASEIKMAGQEIKSGNVEAATERLATAAGEFNKVVTKVENSKVEADKFLKRAVNGLDQIQHLADALGSLKNIQKTLKNVGLFSKQIKAKNKFGAIAALKSTIGSVASAGSQTKRLSNKIQKLGSFFK